MSRTIVRGAFIFVVLTVQGAFAGEFPQDQPAARARATATPKNDYGKTAAWLCRPDAKDNACDVDLTTTVVAANGELKAEKWQGNPRAPIDCFYVYPTVSTDVTPNSDMTPGPEERRVVAQQFARFGSVCRLYAPLYRQVTLTALIAGQMGKPMPVDRALAYSDVADAWRYYLEHDNGGRGVVLIGHSQGSMVLTQLIRNEIDGKPAQSRLVSALLVGTNLPVPRGQDVGGAFRHLPLCRTAGQASCIVTYASFRATVPPPANSLFGRVAAPGSIAGCTNPAALSGGTAALHAYFPSAGRIFETSAEFRSWVSGAGPIATPFVSLPGLISGQCVADEHGSYLAITVHANPADPRTDEIPGDVVANGQVQANWGLHLVDMNLAMGDLVDLVARQAQAYLGTRKSP